LIEKNEQQEQLQKGGQASSWSSSQGTALLISVFCLLSFGAPSIQGMALIPNIQKAIIKEKKRIM
jgi:hypothetical protein